MGDPRHTLFCVVSVANYWLFMLQRELQKLWKVPTFRHFVILYCVTFALILPVVCHNLRHSLFFTGWLNKDQGERSLKDANDVRLAEARKFLSVLDQSKIHHLWHGDSPDASIDVALGIITVSRNRHTVDKYEPHYLTQAVAQFLVLLQEVQSRRYRLHIELFVCNVDHDPGSYHEAQEMGKTVPVVSRYNKTTLSVVHPKEKEKQDYVFCLDSALRFNPRYVFLAEDDALPHRDFFPTLDHILQNHLDNTYQRGSFTPAETARRSTLYVKFYHPERLLGFISLEPERLPELLSLSAVLSTIMCIIYKKKMSRTKLVDGPSVSLGLVWLMLFVYCALAALVIGRSNLTELRRVFTPHLYSYGRAPDCCTPAMLFPRHSAQQVSAYLSNVTCDSRTGKDTVLDGLVRDQGWKTYLVQPNTFTHIGLYSAVRQRKVDPFVV